MIYPDGCGRSRRHAAGVGVAVTLMLALAACGDGADSPTVATAGSPGVQPTASAAAAGSLAAYVDGQRRYAKCLREHGMEVPDPDAEGRIDFSSALRGRSKTDPEILNAQKACREYQLPVPAEVEEQEPVTPEQLAAFREYAKCMRANGMPRWPDPRPDGSWPADGAGELTPQEQAANLRALQICEPVLEGRPPTTPNPNASSVG